MNKFIPGCKNVFHFVLQMYFSLRNLTNEFGRLREGLTYDYGKPLLPFNEGHPIDCRYWPSLKREGLLHITSENSHRLWAVNSMRNNLLSWIMNYFGPFLAILCDFSEFCQYIGYIWSIYLINCMKSGEIRETQISGAFSPVTSGRHTRYHTRYPSISTNQRSIHSNPFIHPSIHPST